MHGQSYLYSYLKNNANIFCLGTTPSITSDVMKGLRSEAGGGEGTGAGEGTTGAGLFSGFTAEDSSLQSLNTGDFQLGERKKCFVCVLSALRIV